MTSTVVSSMALFLLVLLVFPHIDMVLGAQMEHSKLKETNQADQVTVQAAVFKTPEFLKKLWNSWTNKPPKFKSQMPPNSCKQYLAVCRRLPRTSALYSKANCKTVEINCNR